LREILTNLEYATDIKMMNLAGWSLHQLKGKLADQWSVKVNGNWRITFRFVDENAEIVDYQDYH
jgi:proteic killer suppression protein